MHISVLTHHQILLLEVMPISLVLLTKKTKLHPLIFRYLIILQLLIKMVKQHKKMVNKLMPKVMCSNFLSKEELEVYPLKKKMKLMLKLTKRISLIKEKIRLNHHLLDQSLRVLKKVEEMDL